MSYLLSIIIPTKNRSYYCLESVKEILEVCDILKTNQIEIVIQDNSDTDSLKESILALNADNIKYNYTGKILSFVDNFSEAVSLASGEYLCMIGDDDGILPNILEEVYKAKEKNIHSIIPSLNAVYIWPMENSIVANGDNGYLYTAYINEKSTVISTSNSLQKMLSNGGQDYQKCDMPRLYHGIIHRSLTEKIFSKTNYYFGGLTPDIYMATALTFVCDKSIKLGYPITISGICTGSGSANSAQGKHTGELSDAPHFIGHDTYEWEDIVPQIYTVETIWADTALHAVRDFNEQKVSDFNVVSLLAHCYQKYPQFKKRLNVFKKEHKISGFDILKKRISFFAIPLMKRIVRRLVRTKKDMFKAYDVKTVSDAQRIISKKILNRG